MLVNYFRNKNGQPVGCVVAIGPGVVGWSKCNTKKDRFDKEMAKKIAAGRAEVFSSKPIPECMNDMFSQMTERSYRYFKDNYNANK